MRGQSFHLVALTGFLYSGCVNSPVLPIADHTSSDESVRTTQLDDTTHETTSIVSVSPLRSLEFRINESLTPEPIDGQSFAHLSVPVDSPEWHSLAFFDGEDLLIHLPPGTTEWHWPISGNHLSGPHSLRAEVYDTQGELLNAGELPLHINDFPIGGVSQWKQVVSHSMGSPSSAEGIDALHLLDAGVAQITGQPAEPNHLMIGAARVHSSSSGSTAIVQRRNASDGTLDQPQDNALDQSAHAEWSPIHPTYSGNSEAPNQFLQVPGSPLILAVGSRARQSESDQNDFDSNTYPAAAKQVWAAMLNPSNLQADQQLELKLPVDPLSSDVFNAYPYGAVENQEFFVFGRTHNSDFVTKWSPGVPTLDPTIVDSLMWDDPKTYNPEFADLAAMAVYQDDIYVIGNRAMKGEIGASVLAKIDDTGSTLWRVEHEEATFLAFHVSSWGIHIVGRLDKQGWLAHYSFDGEPQWEQSLPSGNSTDTDSFTAIDVDLRGDIAVGGFVSWQKSNPSHLASNNFAIVHKYNRHGDKLWSSSRVSGGNEHKYNKFNVVKMSPLGWVYAAGIVHNTETRTDWLLMKFSP